MRQRVRERERERERESESVCIIEDMLGSAFESIKKTACGRVLPLKSVFCFFQSIVASLNELVFHVSINP